MKILVIQQKMIGDVLTSTIICELLKKNIAGCEVHYLINLGTEAVVNNNPFVDNIIFFKPEFKESKLEFYYFLKSVRNYNFDVVIDAYRKLESKLVTLFSGASIKISHQKTDSFLYYNTRLVYLNKHESKDLAIQNRIQLTTPLISKIPKSLSPKIFLTQEETNNALLFLERHNIDTKLPLYMISVLGSNDEKTYPLDYMATVINKIASNGKCQILFNYIPSQKKKVEIVFNQCNSLAKSYISLDTYASSLRGFLAILSKCDALIGNEGGSVNMAKALNIPTFAIFSPWITKEAWGLFQDKKNISVHLNDFKAHLFENKSLKTIKKSVFKFYREFNPELFEKQLEVFLNS